jgi:hypothetical protein
MFFQIVGGIVVAVIILAVISLVLDTLSEL